MNFDERPIRPAGAMSYDDVPVGGQGRGGRAGGPTYADAYGRRGGASADGHRPAAGGHGNAPSSLYSTAARSHTGAGLRLQGVSFYDFVMWKNPRHTGSALGAILLVLFVFGFMEYTMVTFACRAAQVMFVSYWLLSYLGRIPAYGSDELKRTIHDTVGALQPLIVRGIDRMFRVLAWESPLVTLKCIFASIVLGILGNVLSDITLLFIATVVTFVGPLAYHHNKEVVDPMMQQVNSRASLAVDHLRGMGRPKAE